jgi:eukaryotic-like serine/threonine-protein kinase
MSDSTVTPGTECPGDRVLERVALDGVRFPGGICLDPPRAPGHLGAVGDFDAVSVLGEGSMGVVLRAIDRSLGREVALKLLSNRLDRDPVSRLRFLQEARSVAQLNHPNIVTIYSIGEYKEIPYLAMEYVVGRSLADLLAEEGRPEPGRAIRITCDLLLALEHAHAAGVVHRDVKPANILFEAAAGRLKLADFGLAHSLTQSSKLTIVGSLMGTPSYMAPEQTEGATRPDPRQDLFAVGVILFEMLVGALPFPGSNVLDVLSKIRKDPAPDPCAANPAISRALAVIVLHSLEKDPARRFQSATAFATALQASIQASQSDSRPFTHVVSAPATTATLPGLLLKCSLCGSTMVKSQTGLGGTCAECNQPICSKCWTIRAKRRCAQHA